MIPDWKTNTLVLTDATANRFPGLSKRLLKNLLDFPVTVHGLTGVKDIWTRDFAPVQAGPHHFVQFRYRPDYLQGYSHLITPAEICRQSSLFDETVDSPLVLDGGNIVGTSQMAILTEKVWHENQRLSRTRIRNQLTELLQVNQIITLPVEPGDAIGHADGMVRFLDESTVVVNDYRPLYAGFADAVENELVRAGLNVVRLPYAPDIIPTGRGEIPSAVGNYVNYLRVGSVVILPAYGLPEDKIALRKMRAWLPDCQVHSLPCRELAQEGGVLNCIVATLFCEEQDA